MASQFPMPVRHGGPSRRTPLDPLVTVQRDMDRLFGNLVRSFVGSADGLGQTPLAPRIDVSETADGVRLDAELPGAAEHEIEVSLDGDELVIAGEIRRELAGEENGLRVAERQVGRFRRSIHLPFEPDPDKVDARFRDGLLTIAIARPVRKERPRRIALASAERGTTDGRGQAAATDRAGAGREAADA